jgi:hypothetical protein
VVKPKSINASCSTHLRDEKCVLENAKGREYFVDQGVGG